MTKPDNGGTQRPTTSGPSIPPDGPTLPPPPPTVPYECLEAGGQTFGESIRATRDKYGRGQQNRGQQSGGKKQD